MRLTKRNIISKVLAVALAAVTLVGTPLGAVAVEPPGNVPIVTDDSNSQTSSEEAEISSSNSSMVSSDDTIDLTSSNAATSEEMSSEDEEPTESLPGVSSNEGSSAEDMSSSQEESIPSEDSSEPALSASSDTPAEEETTGKTYPFPGTIVLVDADGNLLPMPRTVAAIIEGPMWNNPGAGQAHYLFVTFNGRIAYCVDPFAHNTTGGVDYLQKTDWIGLKDTGLKNAVSYILKFGSPSGNDANNDWHVATQCLIWEVVRGDRKPDMEWVSGKDNIYYRNLSAVFPGMTSFYNKIIDQVKSWKQIPSFANQTESQAPTYKLEGDGPYTITLTNSNTACNLSNFDFKANGVTFTVSGNDLVISSPTEITSEISVEGGRTDADNGAGYIFWYDPRAIPDQTRMSPGPDPVPCYFKLGTEATPPGGGEDIPPLEGDYSITIQKFEAGSNDPLDGAAFDVEYLGPNGDIVVPPPPAPEPDPGEGLSTLEDDTGEGGDAHVEIPTWGPKRVTITSGGKIVLKVPYRGYYKVTEVIPPVNHLLAAVPMQNIVCTDADPNPSIDFHNEPYTSIRVKKIDKLTGQPLSGATIHVEKVDGSAEASKQTGADGIALFPELEPGAYKITEEKPPEGYEKTDIVVTRNIQPNRIEEVIIENTPKVGFRIRKVAAETGQGLQGAVFELYEKDGRLINSYISGPNGLITVEKLPAGWYTVIEKQPPDGYLLDPDHTSQDVHLDGTQPQQDVIFRDPKRPGLVIEKLDKQTRIPLAGATFEIRERDGAKTVRVKTGPDGKVTVVGLEDAWYVVTEVEAPAGYLPDPTPQIVQLQPGKNASLIFEDSKKLTLTLRKVDEAAGEGIPGVTLRVAWNGGLQYKDYVTENGGYITIKDLDPGHYTVTEIACPEGYILDSTPHEIELVADTNKPYTLTITNKEKPSIRIRKTDSETRQPLAGVTFNVKEKNGRDLGNYVTDTAGEILLPNVTPGLFLITEISAPSGYQVNHTPVEVLVEANKIKDVPLQNTPEHPLLLKKVDQKTGLPLAGATFLVQKVGGELVGEYSTGKNGYATVLGLAPGFYQATEIKAPEGYLLNNTPQIVEMKADQPGVLVFEDQAKSSLSLRKIDSKTHMPLANALFRITKKGGTVVKEARTDAEGRIEVDGLEPGWYTCVELEAPAGYLLDAQPKDVELAWNEQKEVEFTNTQFSGVQVLKKDAVTGNPMSGVTLRVSKQGGELIGEYETERGGYFTVPNLEPGVYVVQEVRTLPGYILDETPQTVEVKKGEVGTVTFYNYPENSLQLRKLDAKTKLPLGGVTFKLMHFGGEIVDYYTTNADGYFVAAGLQPGNYVLVETATVEGYQLDPTPVNVTLEAGKTQTVEALNQPLTGLQVMKKDAVTNEPMAGVTMRVSRMDGTLLGDFVTEKGGCFVVSDLTPGWYVIREIKTLPGYVLDETVQNVEIKASGNAYVEFYNFPENTLSIRKIDAETRQPMEGVKFKLCDLSGSVLGVYTTGTDGYLNITGLKPGDYNLIETDTLPGYQLDTSPHYVSLKPGKNETIEITNQPLASLQVKKLDAITMEPIDGVTFEVTTIAGAFVGEYTTANGGYFNVRNLKPGWYTVRVRP